MAAPKIDPSNSAGERSRPDKKGIETNIILDAGIKRIVDGSAPAPIRRGLKPFEQPGRRQ